MKHNWNYQKKILNRKTGLTEAALQQKCRLCGQHVSKAQQLHALLRYTQDGWPRCYCSGKEHQNTASFIADYREELY